MRQCPTWACMILAVSWLTGGCTPAKTSTPEKAASPASVSKIAKEDDLGTVVLKPEAEARLGLATAVAERKPMARSKTYAGEVIVPPGRLIVVSSPFPATVISTDSAPTPGQPVKVGQTILSLIPILSAEARAQIGTLSIEAQGAVTQARKQLEVAKTGLDRVEGLRKNGVAVGAGAVEDARNAYSLAETALRNTEARRDLLAKTMQEAGAGTVTPIPLTAPENGILRAAQAGSGQQVASGTILFEVERLDPVWVRVPVYVGDMKSISTQGESRVGALSDRPTDTTVAAKPVVAPPTGDPLAATVDLYYEMPNPGGAFRPGQRLGVTVPMKGEAEGLVVPASALYHDIQGGTWIYEQIKDHTFVRRRVEVESVTDGSAVLARGLNAGAKVVTVAVPELYGTEFGFAK